MKAMTNDTCQFGSCDIFISHLLFPISPLLFIQTEWIFYEYIIYHNRHAEPMSALVISFAGYGVNYGCSSRSRVVGNSCMDCGC